MKCLEEGTIEELKHLGVLYALVTLLRVVWSAWLAPVYGVPVVVGYLLPNPLGLFEVVAWLSHFFETLMGAAGVNDLVDLPLLVGQLALIVLAVRAVVADIYPDLLARLPIGGLSADLSARLDGRRLRRPWWIVPAYMAFGTFCTLSLAIAFFGNLRGRTSMPEVLWNAGGWPLWISLGLAALGLLWGYRFNQTARQTVATMFGAQPLAEDHWLTRRVHTLAKQLDLPLPAVAVVNEANAFAVGSSPHDAMVVLGVPLVKGLTPEQLDAVIGHELGHVVSSDMRQMQFAVGYQRMFGDLFAVIAVFVSQVAVALTKSRSGAMMAEALGDMGRQVGGVVLFFGGELMSKGLSRRREYYADAIGAALTTPEAMSGALDRIADLAANPTPAENRFAYLMFKGGRGRFRPLSTHPSHEQRKRALAVGSHLRRLPRQR